MPDAAANPSSRHCVRQALFIPPCRAGWFRCGGCERVAPLLRLRRLFLRGATPTPPLSWFFWVAVEGSEAPTGIDAPERKSAAAGGSKKLRAAFAPNPGSGIVFRFVPHLHTMPPPRHLAAESWECASGTSFVLAESQGSRCRLRALMASSVVLVAPVASALVPRLCSLVAPAGTLP